MKICVIGLGYIGFPTACLLANAGHEVVGAELNESIVQRLRNGDIHITDEDGLGELARRMLTSRALIPSTAPEEADAFIICVPTPLREGPRGDKVEAGAALAGLAQVAAAREGDGQMGTAFVEPDRRPSVDLSYVESAVHAIAPFLRAGNLVIVESTVPPGTTENVVLPILEGCGWNRGDILLAHAPERVIPGAIMRELVENDRVIGGLTPDATAAAKELYESLVKGNIFTTDATTAEFVKLMENTYRDVNIALANEFARVAEHLGIDVQQAIAMANRHPRVNVLSPGPGVGGHCIPVDPHFIIEQAPHLTPLMQAARAVNDGMVQHVVNVVDKLSQEEGLHRWVILGASYKANVADERNSPSLAIAQGLKSRGLAVTIHDPYVERFNVPLLPGDGPDEALGSAIVEADGLLLITDHRQYLDLDPETVGRHMARRFVVDTRLALDADAWERNGFVVRRLGDGRKSRVWASR